MRMRSSGITGGLLALALAGGCSRPEPALAPEAVIPLDQLPPGVLEKAQAALPEVDLEVAWKENELVDGQVAYEVRGRTQKGQIRDVKVLASGEVVEID